MATEAAAPLPESTDSNHGPTTTVDSDETPTYMASLPKEKGQTWRSIFNHGHPMVVDATFTSDILKQTWQQCVSAFCVKILWRSYSLLKIIGLVVEWTINLFVLNHGPFHLFKLLFFRWRTALHPIVSSCILNIWGVDPRTDLYVDMSKMGKAESTRADALVFPDENVGSRKTADVCVMAAKLAYENAAYVKHVVEDCWKMHFVKFHECWNDYQKMNNTQALVCMDKPTDANAVVVAFRGTEPFNAYDWSTDFDFSWVKLEGLGGVHLGFLEALGLATREDLSSLTKLRNKAHRAQRTRSRRKVVQQPVEEIEQLLSSSGLADNIINSRWNRLAFDDITVEVARLLHQNPKAKLFLTGHSLGGALAALYAIMLHYTGLTEIADRIGAVYTFGGPRIGDEDVKDYGNAKLAGKFFRIVYCNDLVPRIPFDNEVMAFKHFGLCAYFNSVYNGLTVQEEPNPNFFGIARLITMHLNAVWEIFQGLILITLKHGQEFTESTLSILCRGFGLMLPGFASHSPTNYVNSVRLGPFPIRDRVKGDIADIAKEIGLMQDNVKDIVVAVSEELLILLGVKTPKKVS